jgi:hypothetical protein
MGSNNFEGPIMTEFGNMTSLSWLSMNDNDITGTIPTELGYLVNMTRLSFKDCLLSGAIPSELGNMAILHDLSLEANNLRGTVPPEVCKLREEELTMFVTDCFHNGIGVDCELHSCCTFCRRGEIKAKEGDTSNSTIAQP